MERRHRKGLSRVWFPLVTVVAIALLAGAWWLHRFRSGCDLSCGPSHVERTLDLPGRDSVPVLSTGRYADAVFVSYITKHNPAERVQVCAELEGVLRALVSRGEFASVREAFISPTFPRMRVLGWTWRGPALSCCASVGYHAAIDAEGRWTIDNSGCERRPTTR
jgi:hypothetical protein